MVASRVMEQQQPSAAVGHKGQANVIKMKTYMAPLHSHPSALSMETDTSFFSLMLPRDENTKSYRKRRRINRR